MGDGASLADHQASAALQGFLANFVKTGNPNGDGLSFWPWIQASIPKVMVIEAAPHPVNAPNGRRYEFLDAPSLANVYSHEPGNRTKT